jgi:hypothetical protein
LDRNRLGSGRKSQTQTYGYSEAANVVVS